MLDYEILYYKVEYQEKGAVCWFDHLADTEESAINFIKANRNGWNGYRLLKAQAAVIDF